MSVSGPGPVLTIDTNRVAEKIASNKKLAVKVGFHLLATFTCFILAILSFFVGIRSNTFSPRTLRLCARLSVF